MFEDLTSGHALPRARPLSLGATPLIRAIGKRVLNWEPEGSILIMLPNGDRVRFGRAGAHREPMLTINSYRVILKSIRRGALGFAQSYLDGDIECDDLALLFRFFLANSGRFSHSGGRLFKTRKADRHAHRHRHNSRRNARRNILDHYDLGNDFFAQWLDPEMMYSSGIYADATTTLEDSQTAKLDLILQMMAPKEGERVLEIGCGWGGFARHAARRSGVHVTGVTLSDAQLAEARKRARAEALDHAMSFRLQDYRDIPGTFDHIASIEMIEAVGQEYWPVYFRTLADRLKPGGSAVIQAITIAEHRFDAYASSADFIQRYIFPGGMLLTNGAIAREAKAAGLTLERTQLFGPSYARTLCEWRRRFDAAWPRIEAQGFDARFQRLWHYYLTYCEAGFANGLIDVGIYKLVKPG